MNPLLHNNPCLFRQVENQLAVNQFRDVTFYLNDNNIAPSSLRDSLFDFFFVKQGHSFG